MWKKNISLFSLDFNSFDPSILGICNHVYRIYSPVTRLTKMKLTQVATNLKQFVKQFFAFLVPLRYLQYEYSRLLISLKNVHIYECNV